MAGGIFRAQAGYGKSMRAFLKKQNIHKIIDFGYLPVFEEATTYPSIFQMTKTKANSEFDAVNIESLDFDFNLNHAVNKTQITVLTEALSDEGWTLTDSSTQKLIQKLKLNGIPLLEYVDGKIYRGISLATYQSHMFE